MRFVRFSYSGRIAHFLRAESTANALTYPVPPRTVLLGLCGAILGLEKDTTQVFLETAQFAICGRVPDKFWHKANMRKTLPSPLPYSVKKSDKGSSAEEKNTRLPQEMLWMPKYEVFACLPPTYHQEFHDRLKDGRTHFTPCLGLSELIANVDWIESIDEAEPLPDGEHEVVSAVPLDRATLVARHARENELAIQKIRMPRSVNAERIFVHENYLIERDAKPIRIVSAQVVLVGDAKVVLM